LFIQEQPPHKLLFYINGDYKRQPDRKDLSGNKPDGAGSSFGSGEPDFVAEIITRAGLPGGNEKKTGG
jgi:hypothetical protein